MVVLLLLRSLLFCCIVLAIAGCLLDEVFSPPIAAAPRRNPKKGPN